MLLPPRFLFFDRLMTNDSYVLSFTAGGLLYHESTTVAECYLRHEDWEQTVEEIREHNLLQSRTASTTTRKLREIQTRLSALTRPQIHLLSTGSRFDQNMLLWLACCKSYRVLADFAREVVFDKFVRLDLEISTMEVERFFDTKAIYRDEVESLKETTRTKLVTVVMRMLRESELITDNNHIQSPVMSPRLKQLIADDSAELFTLFPIAIDARKDV